MNDTGLMVKEGFWNAVGGACFVGLLYLGAMGLAALAESSKPKTSLVKAPCGCGCGGK